MDELVQISFGIIVAISAGRRVNSHGPATPMLDRITWSIIGAAGIMTCLGVPLSQLPVVVDSRAEVVEHRPGVLRLHVTGRKPMDRGMCELRGLDAYVINTAGMQLEVPHVAEGDPVPGNTRPPGAIDFGVWRVSYPAGYRPARVMFVAHHRCAWWMPLTRTQQGPFNVPPIAAGG